MAIVVAMFLSWTVSVLRAGSVADFLGVQC